MNAAPPKVVALMPAWNAERFIVPVLESLAAQTYPRLEVLISDDASSDATPAICEAFAARHANFRLMRQRRNRGWIGNVNTLLREAEGDYFFFAFHDDLPKPTYVERLAGALTANPRAVLAFSDMIRKLERADASSETAPALAREDNVKVYLDLQGIRGALERSVVVARKWGKPPSYAVMLANRGLFRASAARSIGGLRRHFAGEFGADWPWLLALATRGEFERVPEPLIAKSYRATSLSATWRYSLWQRIGALGACMREVARSPLSPAEQLTVHRALIVHALRRQWWAIRGPRRGAQPR